MALVLADRVKESTTTTGTGTVTLSGATPGFQSFAAVGTGNTTYYCIASASDWEVGVGTYTSGVNTLSRTTVLSSSNAGALVNFGVGAKDVFCALPSSAVASQNAVTTAGTSTAYTLTPTPPITSYQAGMTFLVTFNAASGDQPTLQISGLATPPNLVYEAADGSYLNVRANMITANHITRVTLISTTQALVDRLAVDPSAGSFRTSTLASDITLTYSDMGAMYVHTDATVRNVTIPANASVPLPVGFTLSVYNDTGAANVNFAITTDTLVWLGAGTTGPRVLGASGLLTLTKVTSTKWAVSGANVS